MDVTLYLLTLSPVEKVLPKLLEKAIAADQRVVICADQRRLEALNQTLWTYTPGGFLPHDLDSNPNPQHQPILLSPGAEPVNGARTLVWIGAAPPKDTARFDRILHLVETFDQSEMPTAVEDIRRQVLAGYGSEAQAGAKVWQQTAEGWSQI